MSVCGPLWDGIPMLLTCVHKLDVQWSEGWLISGKELASAHLDHYLWCLESS